MNNWIRDLTGQEKKAFCGAFLGHAVDVFDFMIYSFLIATLLKQWGMDKQTAGLIVTYTLFSSLIGAIIAGVLADRFGRVRVLRWTIICFAVSCFLCGLSNSPSQLMLFRVLQGLGFGGESSLCMVLVTEMIRNPEHRGKYSGFTASSYSFGWGAAALAYWAMYSLLPAAIAWRGCFFLGILPALVVIYLRRNLQEPEIFQETQQQMAIDGRKVLLREVLMQPLLKSTLLCGLLSGGMLGGYYAIATWLPTYLKTERHLSIFGTSSYLTVTIIGSFIGYAVGSYATDRLGRRPAYILFALAAFAIAMSYMFIPISNTLMLFMSLPLGILMQGMFSGIGATISEMYPNHLRATGYGVAYNVGRVIGSFFPLAVGKLSSGTMALGPAIAVVAGAGYVLVVITALLMPETLAKNLRENTASPAPEAATVRATPAIGEAGAE